jgi:hypothetical protein
VADLFARSTSADESGDPVSGLPDRPRVSIVIPVFNGANYLAEAIDSALAQTWPELEVIVVDDGSTDGGATVRVAAAHGDRIRLIRRGHGGVAAALNAGIAAMTGDLFAWLSHDDVYLPHKVERQIEVMRRHPGPVIAYSDYELVGRDLRRIKTKRLPDVTDRGFRTWLLTHSSLHGCTLLVPRACLAEARFDERLATTQDYDLWFRLASDYRFVRVPEILLRYRIHDRQESWTNPRRTEEGNRLLLGFLEQVGPAEIEAATGRPAGLTYLEAAVRFKFRGYREAAGRALERSGDETRTIAQHLTPRRIALRAAYAVARPELRPMDWWKRLRLGRPGATGLRRPQRSAVASDAPVGEVAEL